MKTYLVTGGAGFIGSHLVEEILKNGDRAVIVDNFNDFYNPEIKKKNVAESNHKKYIKSEDVKTGKVLVEVDPKYFRPAEVEQLLGDPTKAKTLLGWNPTKTSFAELVKIMVKADMKMVEKEDRIKKSFD